MVYSWEINLLFLSLSIQAAPVLLPLLLSACFFDDLDLSSWFAFLMIAYTAAHNTSPTESPCLVSCLDSLDDCFLVP